MADITTKTSKGLLGTKLGMTQVWNEAGKLVPVTVIQITPNVVTQVRTPEKDGYSAVQIAAGQIDPRKVNQPKAGHFKAAGTTPRRHLTEVRTANASEYELGQEIAVDVFAAGQKVDVVGTSKGKGFAGVIKKWGFAGGNMTHGGHSKRRTGGLAARDLPGWIEKGKKMPGHMGDVNRKNINLEVVQIRPEDNAILVKGSIPGARNGLVFVRKSLKNAALAFKAQKGAK